MLNKIKQWTVDDNLFFQKAGLIVGAFIGVLVGLFISEKADGYEVIEEIMEEEIDGTPAE